MGGLLRLEVFTHAPASSFDIRGPLVTFHLSLPSLGRRDITLLRPATPGMNTAAAASPYQPAQLGVSVIWQADIFN
jgi:hypothetical protein